MEIGVCRRAYTPYNLEDESLTSFLPCPNIPSYWGSPTWIMPEYQRVTEKGAKANYPTYSRHSLGGMFPSTDITAIGREMTRVAVSIKDILRELKELELSQPESQPEASNTSDNDDNNDDDDDDMGKDLSPEEFKIAELAIGVVSEVIVVIKELIRSITDLLRRGDLVEKTEGGVDSLEELLSLSRSVGVLVDELGACLYPPQEISAIRKACEDISSRTDDMVKKLESINGSMEAFSRSCKSLKKALELLVSEISSSSDVDVVSEMENLSVEN